MTRQTERLPASTSMLLRLRLVLSSLAGATLLLLLLCLRLLRLLRLLRWLGSTECRSAKCRSAECSSAECRGAERAGSWRRCRYGR